MATYSNTAREVEMPNGDVVVIHNAPTGGENTTSNIKKFKYDDNGHVTESTAANATDLNLNSYSTPTTGSTAIGTSDAVQTAIGKLDHQSQIDQTNILYSLNTGVKNVLSLSGTQAINGITYTPQEDGTIKATGTATANAAYYLNGSNKYIPNVYGGYKFHALSNGTDNIYALVQYSNDGSQWAAETAQKTSEITVASNYPYVNFVLMVKNGTTPNQTFSPMLCTPEAWAQSHDFKPYALPNYDLTRLEAEDRAALAEEIDAGAKNLLDVSQATFGNKSKVTFNADGSVTGNITDDARIWGWNVREFTFTLPAGTYCMHVDVTGGSNVNWGIQLRDSSNNTYGYVSYYMGTTAYFTLNATTTLGFIGKIFDRTLYIMLCTKAAFGVSQKFVPYRPDMYDYQWQAISTYLLARRSGRTITINGYIANISFTANTATLIGNVNTTVGRPHESVRTLCNVGANAYTVGTLGYLILQQDGNIYVTTAYEGTGAVYVSLSYTI